VIGESQILGQLRHALRIAREQDTVSRALSEVGSLALRTGKRAQTETAVGGAGASLVSVGLQAAAEHLGADDGLAGHSVLVIGAGSMSALAVASVTRAGAAEVVVANRTRQRAERLAAGVGGRGTDMTDLVQKIAAADLVVTCTGAPGHVITTDMVISALAQREGPARPLVLLDLAMPRDVAPGVGDISGVAVTDLDTLAADGGAGMRPGDAAVDDVRTIVAEELKAHLSAASAASVAPTVVALREKAAKVVEAEMTRLVGRLGDLDEDALTEVAKSMRRVTEKLLHAPTVRVKELAGAPGADSYEDALRVLFDLDPAAVQSVAQADVHLAGWAEVQGGEQQ
jgi:glutamyl-tRNA reductase